jgi:2-haloacid dehalogenase
MPSRAFGLAAAAFFLPLILLSARSGAQTPAKPRFKAVAFDYFVIFDANSVIPEVEKVFPGKGAEFTRAWRAKLFEYNFIRSSTDDYRDFFEIIGDALDYTAESLHQPLSSDDRQRLVNAFLHLKPWPDVVEALQKLKAAGVRIITISNFSSFMLRANAENAGIAGLFDELLSTEVNRTLKPDARAYQLGIDHLHLRKDEILFAAFGGWDAYGAKHFGYTTIWVNRFQLPAEKFATTPDKVSPNLSGVLELVLASPQN